MLILNIKFYLFGKIPRYICTEILSIYNYFRLGYVYIRLKVCDCLRKYKRSGMGKNSIFSRLRSCGGCCGWVGEGNRGARVGMSDTCSFQVVELEYLFLFHFLYFSYTLPTLIIGGGVINWDGRPNYDFYQEWGCWVS